jgi:hypothetical protein
MHSEQNDEVHAQELAVSLQGNSRPLCPQLRGCRSERLYPVQGYCVLTESPGWFMIPSIEEYREYCATPQYGECCWFRRIDTEEMTGASEALPAKEAI